jgi:2-alkyl-3-oxoalkanoate reductase
MARKDLGGQMKTVLVIGGAGYLGRAMCDLLLEQGYGVNILVRDEDSTEGMPSQVNVTRGTVASTADIERALGDATSMVNCSVIMPDRLGLLPWELFYEVNVRGGQAILEVAQSRDLERVILLSTAGVLSKNAKTGVYDDAMPFRKGFNHYLTSKILFEQWLKDHEATVFPRWVILRPSSIYGPGPSFKWPQIVDLAKAGKVVMLSDGRWLHPLVHVKDLAMSVLSAMQQPMEKIQKQRITITDHQAVSVREVMESVQSYFGDVHMRRIPASLSLLAAYAFALVPKPLKTERMRLLTPGNVREYTTNRLYDTSKAERLLGFKTMVPFKEGIRETLDFHS